MFKMPENLLNSTYKTVRYKNSKNPVEGDQYAEVLISSSNEDKRSSEEEDRRFCLIKICVHPVSIFIISLIFSLTLCTSYYYIHILQRFPFEDKNNINSNRFCFPLHRVEKVVLTVESTYFKPCSDNKTCHLFLDVIEKEHDGLKYNFVIGPGGELFVGSGFKCLINSEDNALFVKLLKSEEIDLFREYWYLKICSRLSEIINHGIFCEKISKDYTNLVMYEEKTGGDNKADEFEPNICSILEFGKNRSYHVHDSDHKTTLIHGDFGWTFCGNFSSTMNIKKDIVITLESLSKESCSHLQLVDEVTIDVVETPPFTCSDELSCTRMFEENHDGLEYNFIIGHYNIYVGLGFKCRAKSASVSTLKVKILITDPESFIYMPPGIMKYIQILDEGFACKKVSEGFSVKVNYNITKPSNITNEWHYEVFNRKNIVRMWTVDQKHYHMSSENGRGIIPNMFGYQFCPREYSQNTTILVSEQISNINSTTDHTNMASDNSCTPFKQVERIKIVTEKTEYLCSDNATCPSFGDTIEWEHDGLKFNFIIGPSGELFIGSGFKCLVKSEENTMYIKLKYEVSPDDEHDAVCSRFSEVVNHGVLCGKILKKYSYSFIREGDSSISLCRVSESGKNRSHHVHDPDYKVKTLIPGNTGWTVCGNFSNRINKDKERVLTMGSLPNNSCLSLQLVNEIKVDVVETRPLECSDTSSCLHMFEEHHEGLKYNFIIGPDYSVYVGLGFKCRAANSSGNMLKVKVLTLLGEVYKKNILNDAHNKFLQIIDEGLYCGIISEEFSVKANCNIGHKEETDECQEIYEFFKDDESVQLWRNLITEDFDYLYNITSEHGRGIVSQSFRYQFCPRKHRPGIFTDSTTDDEYENNEYY